MPARVADRVVEDAHRAQQVGDRDTVYLCRESGVVLLGRVEDLGGLRAARLHHEEISDVLEQRAQDLAAVLARVGRFLCQTQRTRDIAAKRGVDERRCHVLVDEAQDVRNQRPVDGAVCVRAQLIQNRFRVAHGTVGGPRDLRERGVVDREAVLLRDGLEARRDLAE